MNKIFALAALLLASATFVSCSSDDEITNKQSHRDGLSYTLSLFAKKTDITPADPALADKTISAKWAVNEQVFVFPDEWSRTPIGTLTAASSNNGTTTLTGSITKDLQPGEKLKLLLPRASWDYTGQTGVLSSDENSIEKKYSYALTEVSVASVSGNIITTLGSPIFENKQAIVKFILQDVNSERLNVSSLNIFSASNRLMTGQSFSAISQRYSGYTFDKGTGGFNDSEGAKSLVDGNQETKWCCNDSHKSEGVWYCEFHTANAILVDGYTLTTGGDCYVYKRRNPKDWVLKAKVNASDAWTTIATVTNNGTLPDMNYAPINFDVDNPGYYQYFRLEVSANHGDEVMQLSELQFFQKTNRKEVGSLTVTPVTPTSELTVALHSEKSDADSYTLQADVEGTTLNSTIKNLKFEDGKYYEVTVTLDDRPAYADDALEVYEEDNPRFTSYLGHYQYIGLDAAFTLAKYLSETTGNKVAVIYEDEGFDVTYASSADSKPTSHHELYYYLYGKGFHVYVVPK